MRFTSCGDALQNLRTAASRALATGGISAGGTAGGNSAAAAAGPAGAPQGAAGAATSGQISGTVSGSYSTTNTATPGVDEPDIVKTDGRRIVTITGNVLRVVNAQTRQITGVLQLSAGSPGYFANLPTPIYGGLTPANLLLFGNHALVLFNQSPYIFEGPPAGAGMTGSGTLGSRASGSSMLNAPFFGPKLMLVDLSTATPRIIGDYTMDGTLVDARQVGSVARVVVQSAPHFYFPPDAQGAQAGLAPDRAAIAHAGLSQWLPRYAVTNRGRRHIGLVDCASVSHPAGAAYSGNSMLTVLTFDLSAASLGDGEPMTIVADGDTVYSDGASLYIASRQWTATPAVGTASAAPPASGGASAAPPASGLAPAAAPASGGVPAVSKATGTASATPPVAVSADTPSLPEPTAVPQYTGIYKFDISGPGRPVYEASGTVPGWLLGSSGTTEYSLSAWNGALRVATTIEGVFAAGVQRQAQSAVYVLQQAGSQLVMVGKVGGLGAGEQIYAVRFAGPVGYVVTFRQTDPLYTLDLSDPAQPRVAGQLLLSGYSAYLDPIDATHLIGIGQDTNAMGQTMGTQISLFDVSDPAAPTRLAAYDLQFGHSEAEFDPHAFLYWPARKLLVIPVAYQSVSEALVLRVDDSGFTRLGTITHPATPSYPGGGHILRSLIVGNALWTLSDAGLKANDMATLTPQAWVPF